MRISTTPSLDSPSIAPVADVGTSAAAAAASPATAVESPDSQSAVLKPALAAMDALPAVNQARVAEIRDALMRGDLPFDAGRLASLVQRYHGSGR
ncbi:flagellar biosynthesis anti-sigma factor FlgM [Xylophilus sp. GW821-FHT01B05]